MRFTELRRQLKFHFQCDCLACVEVDKANCDSGSCEVAQTYKRILKEIKRLEKEVKL